MTEKEKTELWAHVSSDYAFQSITVHRVENGFTIQPDTRIRPTHIAKDQAEINAVLENLFSMKKERTKGDKA